MHAEMLGCIEDHAGLCASLGSALEAARIYGAAAAARERLVLRRSARSVKDWEAAVATARAALGDRVFKSAWAEGQTWQLDMAVRRALAPEIARRVTA
jgi:hypothetical protein